MVQTIALTSVLPTPARALGHVTVTDPRGSLDFDIMTLSLNLTVSGGGLGSGGGAGKVQFHEFTITKVVEASPTLLIADASGRHLQKVVIAVRKAGARSPICTTRSADVLVAGYHLGGPNGSDPEPTASVTFNYQGLTIRYTTPPVIKKRR